MKNKEYKAQYTKLETFIFAKLEHAIENKLINFNRYARICDSLMRRRANRARKQGWGKID